MKTQKLMLIVLFVLLKTIAFAQVSAKDFNKLEWLTGNWNRTNVKPGKTASESWNKVSALKLVGKGVALKGTDTAFVEKLELLTKDNSIFYVANVAGNSGPVYFKLTELTANGFTCENAAHDFPKKIIYKLSDGKLTVTVSGNGKAIDFIFVKKA